VGAVALALVAGGLAAFTVLRPALDDPREAAPAEPDTRQLPPRDGRGTERPATPSAPGTSTAPTSPAPSDTGAEVGFNGPFRTFRDAERGFSVQVPAAWRAQSQENFAIFTQPGSGTRPDLLVSVGAREEGGPEAALANVEKLFTAKLTAAQGYRRIRLEPVRGPAEGSRIAEWEFSYVREPRTGVRWRVLERAVEPSGGRQLYILRWRFPEAQWQAGVVARARFVRTFTPTPVGTAAR
jgi:hypothetical protein